MRVHWAGTGGGDESATGSLPAGVSPGVSEDSREGHGKTGEGPWGRPVPPAQPVYAPVQGPWRCFRLSGPHEAPLLCSLSSYLWRLLLLDRGRWGHGGGSLFWSEPTLNSGLDPIVSRKPRAGFLSDSPSPAEASSAPSTHQVPEVPSPLCQLRLDGK